MEGAQGKLRARLADRLGGTDADRFPLIDDPVVVQGAAVAYLADAVLRVAHERGAHVDLELGALLREDALDLVAAPPRRWSLRRQPLTQRRQPLIDRHGDLGHHLFSD